jgi:prevent-host-death family protein
MANLNIHEAKTHFSKLLDRVAHGEDVVISRAGVPIAVVVGIDRYKPKREFGFARGAFQMPALDDFNAPLDPEVLAHFTGETE